MHSTETTIANTPTSRTKNILVIIGILAAIILGALLMYSILVAPSRQPYRDALTQYEHVIQANAALTAAGANLNATTATDTVFADNIKTARNTLGSLKAENEALGKKDVLASGEGKEFYGVFNKHMQSYMTFNEDLLTSLQTVRPVLFGCNNGMANLTEDEASALAIHACANSLRGLTTIPNADYKTMITSLEMNYTKLAGIFDSINALSDPKGADKPQHDALVRERTQVVEDNSAVTTAFWKSFQQHRQEALAIDPTGALKNFLKSKSRVF